VHYFSLTCKTYLKQDIAFEKIFNTLSKYINWCLVRGGLQELHEKKSYKHYAFGAFRPSKDDIACKKYTGGKTYAFEIRSLDEQFINTLATALWKNIDNPHVLVIQTTKKAMKQHFISELYTLTPTVVLGTENKESKPVYWTIEKNGDILQLQKQLHNNLLKKYESFYGEKLEPSQNFIQLLEIKNKKPQNIRIEKEGKKITFFGNKFRIVPNEDETSQKLAFVAMGCGLGEKNSYGSGFCLGRGMR
jgi:CRISPR-associated endoribonuclease Cas6